MIEAIIFILGTLFGGSMASVVWAMVIGSKGGYGEYGFNPHNPEERD